jgi:DNA-directed RNA polymerase subunit RPC12/RpoP
MPDRTFARVAAVRCPSCGDAGPIAWYLEPVAYRGHFETNDDGEPEFVFDQAGEIDEGGDFDAYACARCGSVLEVEDYRLVAKGER